MSLLSDIFQSPKCILLQFEKSYSSPLGILNHSLWSKRMVFMSQNIKEFCSSTGGHCCRNEGLGIISIFCINSQSPSGCNTVLEDVPHPKLTVCSLCWLYWESRHEAAYPPNLQHCLRLCKYFPWSSKSHTVDSIHPLLLGVVFLMPFPKPSIKVLGQLQGENIGFTSLKSKNKLIHSHSFVPEVHLDVRWGNIPVVS